MSVEPWTLFSPRRALMPPPATPMLPSNCCRMVVAPDDLHPGGMLGAAHGIEEGAGLADLAGGAVGGRQLQEDVLGHAGGGGHQLRGVAGVQVPS